MKPAGRTNPFYVLLVIAGIVFCVTACAYGMMAVRGVKATRSTEQQPEEGLILFLDKHGAKLLAGEIAVLAVATIGAMASDSWWSGRESRKNT